jgi:hypothetical protein
MMPYLYKNTTYRYEEEIRFVFGIHSDLVQGDSTYAAPRSRGIAIKIDPSILIDGIHVSPEAVGGSPFTMKDEPLGLSPT